MTTGIALLPFAPADGQAEELVTVIAPGLGDAQAARELVDMTARHLAASPRPEPWGSYLARVGEDIVGTCAFKAAPQGGAVEIAYFTFPAFEGRGHATAMIAALSALAHEGGASAVVAHTLPEENASTRALRKNGFAHAGDVTDPEDGPVWRWTRPAAP